MPPIGADFNKNDSNFIVVSPNQICIYCGETGNLLKIFRDIKDTRCNSEIKSFALDSN